MCREPPPPAGRPRQTARIAQRLRGAGAAGPHQRMELVADLREEPVPTTSPTYARGKPCPARSEAQELTTRCATRAERIRTRRFETGGGRAGDLLLQLLHLLDRADLPLQVRDDALPANAKTWKPNQAGRQQSSSRTQLTLDCNLG